MIVYSKYLPMLMGLLFSLIVSSADSEKDSSPKMAVSSGKPQNFYHVDSGPGYSFVWCIC